MNDTAVLVLSCNSYSDCWEAFYHCFKKYWPNCPFPIYLTSESKTFDKIPTICTGEPVFTTSAKKALEQLDTKYVIILLEDFFIRNKVDQDRINYCIEHFEDDVANFNFELEYSSNLETDLDGFKQRPLLAPYIHSTQPGIWNRRKLIEQLSIPQNPWEWELSNILTYDKYYINSSGKTIIDTGRYHGYSTGLIRGKWAKEIVDFFEEENILVDYSKRGFLEE